MDESYETWQTRLAKRQAGMPWTTIASQEGIHVNTFRDGRKRAERKSWLPPETQLPPAVRSDGRRVGRTATARPEEKPMPNDVVEVLPEEVSFDANTAPEDAMSPIGDIVPVSERLSPAEVQSLAHYEQIIEQGRKTFVEVGQALVVIRDQRLYRQSYSTFEEYLERRWDMSRPQGYRMIEAAVVFENLSPIGDIVPVNEAQARPLAALPPEQQREAWQEAVETTPPSGITAKHVQATVKRIASRTTKPKVGKPKAPAPQPRQPPRMVLQNGLFSVLSMVKDADVWAILEVLARQLESCAEQQVDADLMQRMEQALSPLFHLIEDHQATMQPTSEA